MIEISGKSCLIVGGGKIALHKVRILLGFGVKLFVVAPFFDEELEELAHGEEKVFLWNRSFLEEDIEGMDFVVAATDEDEVNLQVAELCKRKGILVNVVDRKEACTFIFPALLQQADILVAVSSGGQSPAAVSYLKEKLRNAIPPYYGKLVNTLGNYRERILREVEHPKQRKGLFYRLLCIGDANEGELPEGKVTELIQEMKQENQEK